MVSTDYTLVASRLHTIQRRSSNSACEAPAEEKLFCSCSSLSRLGERCTDATARARNGERDCDRGRPVSLVRPVRVVPVTSSNLAILEKKIAASATEHALHNRCMHGAL